MEWVKRDTDSTLVREISSHYGIDLLMASIFVRRGIVGPGDIKFYLEDDLRFLHNPFLFSSLEDLIDRIYAAKEEEERVLVFGDRDVDGITATVLLVSALKELGVFVSWALPAGNDPYGLTKQVVDKFHEVGGTLLITVDCGISNHEEIRYAAGKGIDTIVIDHHNPQETLPEAVVIINPKISDSGYPYRDLCGCGVVSKVVWALRFSRTELYNHPLCLLCAWPGNDSVVIEAVKLQNLVIQDRILENLIPGMVKLDNTRLFSFLNNCEVLTYNSSEQTKLLRQVFGNKVDINLIDLSPPLEKYFPSLAGLSLLKIREKSRIAKYSETPLTELDVLVNLFTSYYFKKHEKIFQRYLEDLDLVALGTIADLMPLKNENRILVKQGIQVLNSTKRKGLKELMIKQNLLGSRLSTVDIGWQITPVLNATGRMGVPERAVELFFSEDDADRQKLVETILGLNKERKKLGDELWEKIFPKAKKSAADFQGKFVFIADSSIQRGVTGILASRLVNYFNSPALVIALLEDKGVGSMRTIKGIPVGKFLELCSDLFLDYGGHDCAAGFSFSLDKFKDLEKRIPEVLESLDWVKAIEEPLEIDAELPLDYLTPDLINIVEKFEPYGEESQPLLFLVKGIRIDSLDLVGKTEKQHVKMLLDTGKYKWPALYWNQAERVNRDLFAGDTLEIVFRLGRNYFQNKETLQLTLVDVKK